MGFEAGVNDALHPKVTVVSFVEYFEGKRHFCHSVVKIICEEFVLMGLVRLVNILQKALS